MASDSRQAYALLAKWFEDDKLDAVLCSDGDFSTHLGTECAQIKVLNYDCRGKHIKNITLSMSNNDVATHWSHKLKENPT